MAKNKDYTFKYNQNLGRHGWLRLNPAYSVKLVEEILGEDNLFSEKKISSGTVFDPFCGTATTGIVAAEHGLNSMLYEINPFLYWFSTAKSQNYRSADINDQLTHIKESLNSDRYNQYCKSWIPPMKNIERWWDSVTLKHLGKLHEFLLEELGAPTIHSNVSNLAWISFARLIIDCSAADFGHISVSFKDTCNTYGEAEILSIYIKSLEYILDSAKHSLKGNVKIISGDSRNVCLDEKVSYVITSPPYPNRISYIRELRPYMYWLGFLTSGEEAGELDWAAIGGTWGSATSKLSTWECDTNWSIPACLKDAVNKIKESDSKNGKTLAQYVLKFFYDIYLHFKNLTKNLENGCVLYYILGNSSFYGNMVHTDLIVCEIMKSLGYENPIAKIIRKRNSKKELFEFQIEASWRT